MKKTNYMANALLLSALTLTTATLSNCASEPVKPTGDYATADIGKVNKVVPGVIISERKVNIYNQTLEEREKAAANPTNSDVTRKMGTEYVIRLESGSIISVVQSENLDLHPKQHILVIYGASTRVVADEGSEE